MSSVIVTRDVACPFTAAVALIERFQRKGMLRIGPIQACEIDVDSALAETRDYTDPVRAHEALVLQWRSAGSFPVPRFRGLITMRPQGAITAVRIAGRYVPPFGVFGKMFDAVAGRTIARRSLERLLASIARYAERERFHDE